MFNIAETLIVFLCGVGLQIQITQIIYIVLVFVISRFVFGEPKHYKSWQKCLIWSTLIFLSLFILANANIAVSILLAVFGALILSGKGDIKDVFQWQPKGQSKYQKEIDFVKYNPINEDLIAFENRLKSDNDNFTYMCYLYIFKEGMSWEKTANELMTETYKLTSIIDKIAFGIRLSCHF